MIEPLKPPPLSLHDTLYDAMQSVIDIGMAQTARYIAFSGMRAAKIEQRTEIEEALVETVRRMIPRPKEHAVASAMEDVIKQYQAAEVKAALQVKEGAEV